MRSNQTAGELRVASLLVALLATSATAAPTPESASPAPGTSRYLVQAATLTLAQRDVAQVGGSIERDLEIIHSVSAYLDESQAASLGARADVRVFADRSLHTEGLTSLLC